MTKMLKAKEAAELLNVHLETIRRLARQKEIPAFKVGKGWRFSEETLREWARENNQSPPKTHILIADDEPAVCRLIKTILEPNGYHVSTAFSGRQALEIIVKERIDLVLLDLAMPEMDGIATLKEIRRMNDKLPVIIITGYPDSNLMAEALKASPIIIISKPVDRKQLFDSIALVLN